MFNLSNFSLALQSLVDAGITKGSEMGVPGYEMPRWVWRYLGINLSMSPVMAEDLLLKVSRKAYYREVLYRSLDSQELCKYSAPFAIVAIVLSPGQSTITHDHDVECGPLLIYGELVEFYGYTDKLQNSGTGIAILDRSRRLKVFQPEAYFVPEKNNTHRLQEASDQSPAIALNLYVDAHGRSIRHCFPNFLGIESKSGAEWWTE